MIAWFLILLILVKLLLLVWFLINLIIDLMANFFRLFNCILNEFLAREAFKKQAWVSANLIQLIRRYSSKALLHAHDRRNR